MMAVEGSTITSRIKNLLRSPSIKLRRSKAGNRREDLGSKVSPRRRGRCFPTLASPQGSSFLGSPCWLQTIKRAQRTGRDLALVRLRGKAAGVGGHAEVGL